MSEKKLLLSGGVELKPLGGSGDCFIRSVSPQLYGNCSHHLEIRTAGVEYLRAAPRKYRLNLEIAQKSNFSKLAQNEALRALVTKILF